MSVELCGKKLTDLSESIRDPLQAYLDNANERTGGAVEFDVDLACRLELTPEKPNSARSAPETGVPVTHLGEQFGELWVIAFAPFDGTGDGKIYDTSSFEIPACYLAGDQATTVDNRIVPRPKPIEKTLTELHLTLITHELCSDVSVPFLGNLSLLGIDQPAGGSERPKIIRIADLGQSRQEFTEADEADPTVTLTCGDMFINVSHDSMVSRLVKVRFGDPHAVSNRHPDELQICAFLAISEANIGRHGPLLKVLEATEPALTVEGRTALIEAYRHEQASQF